MAEALVLLSGALGFLVHFLRALHGGDPRFGSVSPSRLFSCTAMWAFGARGVYVVFYKGRLRNDVALKFFPPFLLDRDAGDKDGGIFSDMTEGILGEII